MPDEIKDILIPSKDRKHYSLNDSNPYDDSQNSQLEETNLAYEFPHDKRSTTDSINTHSLKSHGNNQILIKSKDS
jgi:hypothetical protein